MTRRYVLWPAVALVALLIAVIGVRAWSGTGVRSIAGDAARVTSPVIGPADEPVRAQSSARPRITEPRRCGGAAEACVDLSAGLAWLQTGSGITHGPFRIRDGTRDHPTPTGTFHVSWKDRRHTSSIYGLPMPYSVFFAAGGIAFHQGPLDEPSHGCIHLQRHAAALLFDRLDRGDVVRVRR